MHSNDNDSLVHCNCLPMQLQSTQTWSLFLIPLIQLFYHPWALHWMKATTLVSGSGLRTNSMPVRSWQPWKMKMGWYGLAIFIYPHWLSSCSTLCTYCWIAEVKPGSSGGELSAYWKRVSNAWKKVCLMSEHHSIVANGIDSNMRKKARTW